MQNHLSSKRCLAFLVMISSCLALWGQAHISTQAHQDTVNRLAVAKDGSIFSAGKDGFLVRWTEDGLGEHYQITELDIPLIALHPNGSDIAVYETDGYSIHRVSIWNWNSLQRTAGPYTFTNSVTSLDFTARGSLLAVGTATVNGMVFLNPSTRKMVSKIKESTGIVTMFHGSSSERSAVLYSPTGSLSYFNMTTGSRKERFSAEPQLEQVLMFGNNLFCAGVKNNQIYVMDALSGKTIARISARSPILVGGGASPTLYYVETDGRSYTLKSLEAQTTEQGSSVSNPMVVKSLGGINAANAITTGAISQNGIVLGSKAGNLFQLRLDDPAGELVTITENVYDKIYDIASVGKDFYFLTKDTIFRSSYDTGQIDTVGSHSGFTGILSYGQDVILWSRGTKKSVVLLDLETGQTTTLFSPKNYLENLRLFGSRIVYIEGSTTVKLYDIGTGSNSELYAGTGIQDAVLYNGSDLYVAKSASSTPRSPLISVDTATQETVMMPVDGSVAFSLSLDQELGSGVIYGIQALVKGSKAQTTIFAFNPQRKTTTAIMEIADEDVSAFLTMHGDTLYTNIGKSQIRSYDTKTRRSLNMNRSASLPLKLARSGSRIVVLNRDGSISWYNPESGQVIADWYMTTDRQWIEF